ncbi:MAG: hypothetical protein PHE83_19285 [Opitutaceae bacterium]|nr:hypothetical protein [Opitutaceae bacterium]
MSIMAMLLAVGAAGTWAWRKADAVPPEIRTKLGFWDTLRFKNILATNPQTPEQFARHRQQSLALKDKLTAEFPALKATARPVPDDENGFLLLYKLSGGGLALCDLPLSTEFKQILRYNTPWNPEIARRCLAEHAKLVSRIEHIAALNTRSSAIKMPPDYVGFINTRSGKTCFDILMVKARLAAEAGDENETLRLIGAAGNLSSHYRDVETPSLL